MSGTSKNTHTQTCFVFVFLVQDMKCRSRTIDYEAAVSFVENDYLIGHALAVLLSGVDQRLIQVHHQDELFVTVEPLLVFPAQLLRLLSK